MLDRLKDLYRREPARLVAIVVAVIVFAASRLGIVLDAVGLGESIGVALFILLGGEATRSQVTPVPGPVGPDSDELLPSAAFETGPDKD